MYDAYNGGSFSELNVYGLYFDLDFKDGKHVESPWKFSVTVWALSLPESSFPLCHS